MAEKELHYMELPSEDANKIMGKVIDVMNKENILIAERDGVNKINMFLTISELVIDRLRYATDQSYKLLDMECLKVEENTEK